MNTTLLAPAQWAQKEFGLAELGDQRRTKRLVNIAKCLAKVLAERCRKRFRGGTNSKRPTVSRPSREQLRKRLAPHWQRTRAACREPGEYLLIEDTTELDYTNHPATAEMGSIGDGRGRGLWLHSTLAVRVEGWKLGQATRRSGVGFVWAAMWSAGPARRVGRLAAAGQTSAGVAAVGGGVGEVGSPPRGASGFIWRTGRRIFTSRCNGASAVGIDFIIRGYRDRVLADGAGDLKAAVAQAPVLGQMTVEVRSRGGEPARTAMVSREECYDDVVEGAVATGRRAAGFWSTWWKCARWMRRRGSKSRCTGCC